MVKILLLDLRRLSHSALLPRQLVPIVAVLKQLEAWSGRAERHQALDQFSRRDLKWGTVPLLTRDGEVEIAKRIERGQLRVRQVLSRTPLMIKEIMSLGEGLKRDLCIVKTAPPTKSRTYAPLEFRAEDGETPPLCSTLLSSSSHLASVPFGRCVGAAPTWCWRTSLCGSK